MSFAREDDCVVVWELERFSRSIQSLIELAAGLSARSVDFRALTDGFDASTSAGRRLSLILASVAETDQKLVKKRTMAGLAAAPLEDRGRGGRNRLMAPGKLDTAGKLLATSDRPVKVATTRPWITPTTMTLYAKVC